MKIDFCCAISLAAQPIWYALYRIGRAILV